jgi:hypothetical protein
VVAELPQAESYQIGTPGPVGSAVKDEIGGLAAEARPGLTQAALAIARILDNPKAINQQPAAAKVLARIARQAAFSLSARPARESVAGQVHDDEFTIGLGLRSASARGSRGGLAVV